MPMTAKECRVRANECIDLARSADALAHAQLLKMADAWLKLAAEGYRGAKPSRDAARDDK
jgi:hypothetical protein